MKISANEYAGSRTHSDIISLKHEKLKNKSYIHNARQFKIVSVIANVVHKAQANIVFLLFFQKVQILGSRIKRTYKKKRNDQLNVNPFTFGEYYKKWQERTEQQQNNKNNEEEKKVGRRKKKERKKKKKEKILETLIHVTISKIFLPQRVSCKEAQDVRDFCCYLFVC